MDNNLLENKGTQFVVFTLDNVDYALPISCVQEIIALQMITKIPKSPKYIEGVVNNRGQIIPIISAKIKLQLAEKVENTLDTRVILLNIAGVLVGLVVDSISEVIYLGNDDIDEAPVEVTDNSNLIIGIGKFKDRLIILLNHEELLSKQETHSLKNLLKQPVAK